MGKEVMSWKKFPRKASSGYRLYFVLLTAPISIQKKPTIEQPQIPESAGGDARAEEDRKVVYAAMVAEAREAGANRMNLTVRLWQYNLMRNVAITGEPFDWAASSLSWAATREVKIEILK